MEFNDWLAKELKDRGIGIRELARMAGLGPGPAARIIPGFVNPVPGVCQAVARVLRIPEEEVFLRASLLKSPLSKLFAELSVEQREIILTEMRRMVEENERAAAKALLRPATTQA